MSYSIGEQCIKCGKCLPVCPKNAIIKSGTGYSISQEKCVSCGLCERICPVGAISFAGAEEQKTDIGTFRHIRDCRQHRMLSGRMRRYRNHLQ